MNGFRTANICNGAASKKLIYIDLSTKNLLMNVQSCKYPEWQEPKAIKTLVSAPSSIQIVREH